MTELGSAIELGEVTRQVFPALRQLIDVDYGALCIVDPERPELNDWALVSLPETWGAGVQEMAPYDFVRAAVSARPNEVLRDSDMLRRPQLVRSKVYRRCRQLGVPLEQVMAVLVDLGGGAYGGVTLYRDREHPFTAADRAELDALLRPFRNAFRNCHLHRGAGGGSSWMGPILSRRGVGVLLLDAKGEEVERNELATVLLDRHFPSLARRGGVAALLRMAGEHTLGGARPGAGRLQIRIERPATNRGEARFAVEMEEPSSEISIPPDWEERLAPRELEAVRLAAYCYTRKEIAVRMAIGPETVKELLRRAFAKLGLRDRNELVRATRAKG